MRLNTIKLLTTVLSLTGTMTLSTGCTKSGFSANSLDASLSVDSTSEKLRRRTQPPTTTTTLPPVAVTTPTPIPAPTTGSTSSVNVKILISSLCFSAASTIQNGTQIIQSACDQNSLALTENSFSNGLELHVTNTNYCIDIPSGQLTNGVLAQLWNCDSSLEQRFRVISNANGSFSYQSVATNKCLDVVGATASSGAPIQQWSCGDVPEQNLYRIALTLSSSTPAPSPVPTVIPAPIPAPSGSSLAQTTFSTTSMDIQNPERGFYVGIGDDFTSISDLQYYSSISNTRLFLQILDWSAYVNQTLPQSYLDGLSARFALVRQFGGKVILRPRYNYDTGIEAPISLVLQHLSQLKPLLYANADVIAYIQSGLIGRWGEGDSGGSQNLGSPENRIIIRDAWLATAPPQFSIAFQPTDVQTWGAPARITSKNDCYLANDTDAHQFPGGINDPLRAYIKTVNNYQPYGGETCDSASSPGGPRNSCAAILSEGASYSLTYLNIRYSLTFIDQWKSEGCFDEVARQIGYRFQLDAVSHPATTNRGNSVDVNVDLKNVGWARIFSARKLVITLKNQLTGAIISGSAGNANSLSSKATSSSRIVVNVPIPSGAGTGAYDVYVSMPDIYPSIANDPRYAVRFANADDASKGQAFDASTARFKVGTVVNVQ